MSIESWDDDVLRLEKERDAALKRVELLKSQVHSVGLLMQQAAILLDNGAAQIEIIFKDSFTVGAMLRHAEKLRAVTESKEGGA